MAPHSSAQKYKLYKNVKTDMTEVIDLWCAFASSRAALMHAQRSGA